MAYRLFITERADELLDNLIYHLLYRLKNEQAARIVRRLCRRWIIWLCFV